LTPENQVPLTPEIAPFSRHIFVCTGSKCAPEASPALYQYLKERIKALGLDIGPERVVRSQCHCLGICEKGPLAVVYPDNVWYHHLTPEKIDRILREHLQDGRPVREYTFGSVSR